MPEVKSLNITADTYRHRGWMWDNRSIYELLKPHMKLPLWIDRILADRDGSYLFAVGKTDGNKNTVYLGTVERGRLSVPKSFPEHLAIYNCNSREGNGFVVLAERIRAKKPDANKTPRPQWRQPMGKPWEPGTLGGEWVLDSKLVKEVGLATPPPTWADRLWVSTSGGTDTFVWVDSRAEATTSAGERHTAKHAAGVRGHQISGGYEFDNVVTNMGCHWQLAGVRKKTVWVPEPEVRKPATNVPLVTQTEQLFYGTDSGRIPHLNPLLAAPYGTDIYSAIVQQLNISRNQAKVRSFRSMYTRGASTINADIGAFEAAVSAIFDKQDPTPPVGVKPRSVHDEERANALDDAMVRYLNEDLPFPLEWVVEWNELRTRLNKEQK